MITESADLYKSSLDVPECCEHIAAGHLFGLQHRSKLSETLRVDATSMMAECFQSFPEIQVNLTYLDATEGLI